jgi:hypothetical protein
LIYVIDSESPLLPITYTAQSPFELAVSDVNAYDLPANNQA